MSEEKNRLLEKISENITEIPTLPKMVTRILDMMDDPDTKIETIADTLLQDKVLTTRIIRLVNSVFFGIQRDVSSVKDAIVYLGQNQIKNIVLTSSLFSVFPNRNQKFDLVRLWEHGLGCALISRIVAVMAGYNDPEKAYLGGLLHDMGEIVLSQYYQDEFDKVLDTVIKEHVEFHVAEQRMLGIDHSDLAGLFKEHWGFSDDITEVIAFHHRPQEATIDPCLVSIVSIANMFCKVRGLDYGYVLDIQVAMKDQADWKILSENNKKLAHLDMERFTLSMDHKVEEVKTLVKSLYNKNEE